MLKFQRNYRAEFEIGIRKDGNLIPQDKLTIAYPFTCQFYVEGGLTKEQYRGTFQFINLSENDRARLWLDTWNAGKKYIYMKFFAGYGENMPLVFSGFVQFCTSEKQGGSTENITEIQAWEGGYILQYGYLNATFTKGTELKDIIAVATEGDPNLKVGYISPDIKPIRRNKTFIGQTMDLLAREYAGYEVFVTDNEVNILGDRDVIPGEVLVISPESGLLGSPRRGNSFVEADMLFEPQLKAGQAVSLVSYSLEWLNQAYKIIKVVHSGVISPVISGKVITRVTMSIFDSGSPRILEKAQPTKYTGSVTSGVWNKPVQGTISSPFGQRKAPVKGATTNHTGIDIAAPLKTSVNAPANGTVIFANYKGGYGKCVIIDHGVINGKTVTSLYGHLDSYIVAYGQNVSKGAQIASVGSTGLSTGPHLHFEIKENGLAVNPSKYIGNY